jgi:hypothetical protein
MFMWIHVALDVLRDTGLHCAHLLLQKQRYSSNEDGNHRYTVEDEAEATFVVGSCGCPPAGMLALRHRATNLS